jgi:fermentation-respiration switch protein FrsA (DUF1100 family)
MISSVLIAFVALGVLNGWMYLQQSSMTFFPYRDMQATPRDWGLAYENATFDTEDGVSLHGWYIPRQGAKRTLLFFHGNAGNISHRGESITIFHRLGLNVFIFDYRGYGQSEGRPGEKGFYRDAAAAWRYLTGTREVDQQDVVIFGRSLGGAVAARLASEVHPGALILESTLSSSRDFAHAVFPLLSRLIVLRYDFDTADYVQRVSCPLLVLHSPQDEIMPFRLGEKVYEVANEPKVFIEMTGDHNAGFLMSQPGYERQVGEFLSTYWNRDKTPAREH